MIFGGASVPSESAGALGSAHRAGLLWSDARDGEQSQYPDIGPEAVDGGVHIRPASLTRPLFASTIIPPEVVDSLPALPDASYPEGSLAFLTTDGKLYRNVADSWTAEVDGEDIVANSITAGQIAAGAIGTTELAADAVIANVLNAGGTVTIDSSGIEITEGALTFLDDFGETVLTGAGFGATWMDFIDSHVYNHSFRAGTTNAITAATEVNGGATDADYADSISDDIPYWVVSIESGAGTLERIATIGAPSGFAIKWSGDENAEIYQDIPISPGQVYSTYLTWKYVNAASSFFSTIGCQFRGYTHEDIGEPVVEQSLLHSTSEASMITEGMNWSGTAPADARYLRVFIAMTRNAGSPSVWVGAVNVDPINVYGPQRVIGGTTQYDSTYGIAWNNGTTADIALVRTGTNEVTFEVPIAGTAVVRVEGTMSVTDNLSVNTGGASEINLSGNGNIVLSSGFIQLKEISGPAGEANAVRLYVDDNAGTTRLRAVGPGGVRVTLATF